MLLPVAAFFLLRPPGGYCLGYCIIDHFRLNGLQNIVNPAVADGLADKIKIIMAADHNKLGVSGEFIDPGHQLDPAARFHHHIHDDQGRLLLADQSDGFIAVSGF
ncbi:hypothetical protein D3C73_913330 [compost metagenome]